MNVIVDAPTISDLVSRFRATVESALPARITANIGHQGDSWQCHFAWSDELAMWMAYDTTMDAKLGRSWTAFGLARPTPASSTSITTEVNFPMQETNRRIARAFIDTADGDVLVGHRGNIGGGRGGIGKSHFWANYRGNRVTATDYDRRTQFAIVGELHSPRLANQFRDFVAEVARIKSLI